MDELRSSNSVYVRTVPDFEVLDLKIASALKKLLTADFKRRAHMEEHKAQQDDRFLKGKQVAYMIYDCFKISTGEGSSSWLQRPITCNALTPINWTKYFSPL